MAKWSFNKYWSEIIMKLHYWNDSGLQDVTKQKGLFWNNRNHWIYAIWTTSQALLRFLAVCILVLFLLIWKTHLLLFCTLHGTQPSWYSLVLFKRMAHVIVNCFRRHKLTQHAMEKSHLAYYSQTKLRHLKSCIDCGKLSHFHRSCVRDQ